MGMQDKAKHLWTLYLEDLSDFIVECVDPNFGFSRYAERLGRRIGKNLRDWKDFKDWRELERIGENWRELGRLERF
jgi:hypothetical protein